MKLRLNFLAVCALALVGGLSTMASASMVQVAKFANGTWGGTSGGEFKVTFGTFDDNDTVATGDDALSWDSSPWAYSSYCIELAEHISYGTAYKVAFSDRAVMGGLAPAFNGDVLDIATKNIYNDWVFHTPSKTNAGADAVQTAIWKLEEGSYNGANLALKTAADALISGAGTAILANVVAMNVFGMDTTNAMMLGFVASDHTTWTGMSMMQSQVIALGEEDVRVPEPASLALFGMGFAVLSGLRIRSRKQAC